MRNLIIFLLSVLPCWVLGQTNYYLSALGDDNAAGTSEATAWQSLGRLNSVMYQPGDSVLFRSGDLFRGNIVVRQSGAPTGSIVFTSYGAGAKPIISGARVVSNWVQHGDTFSAQYPVLPRNFFVDNVPQTIARYPNAHQYLWLDSANAGYLLDADLNMLDPTWIPGTKICVHTSEAAWEISPVTGKVDDTLKLLYNLSADAKDGFGYFLYDNLNLLDTVGEWKYASNQMLWYMPPAGQSPNAMITEAAIYNFGMQLDNDVCFVTVENLAFEKQGLYGIYIPNGGARYNVIQDCDFYGIQSSAVRDGGKFNVVGNCSFRDIGGIGVHLTGQAANAEIHHNSFLRIGLQPNSGIGTPINLSAIVLEQVDSCFVHHNEMDSVGACGIAIEGPEHIVERNIVRHAMLWNDDGAALKSAGATTQQLILRNNFVFDSDGSSEGTPNIVLETPGIALQQLVNQSTVANNTISQHAEIGLQLGGGATDNRIMGNTVFGGQVLVDFDGRDVQGLAQTGYAMLHNSLFALDDQALIMRQYDFSNAYNLGQIDSNAYFQAYNPANYVSRRINNIPTLYNFGDWQVTGNDLHSRSSFVQWTAPQNDARLLLNMTDDTTTVNLLDSMYYDLDSNIVCGALKLAPYTSQILINAMVLCPTIHAGDPAVVEAWIFPNPTADVLQVRVQPALRDARYRVFDLMGKEVLHGKMQGLTAEVDLEAQVAGVYLLELVGGKQRQVLRLVKQ